MSEKKLPEFVINYLEQLAVKGRQSSTIKRYTYDLLDFFSWLHSYKGSISFSTWERLTTHDIESFFLHLIEKRIYKVRTIRRIHTVLRQLATFCLKLSSKKHAIFLYVAPQLEQTPLAHSEWITEKEAKKLLSIIHSMNGLSERQQAARPYFMKRNETIIRLFLIYGLSLKEVAQLTMNDIRFERNTVLIRTDDKEVLFSLSWSNEDKRYAYDYYKTIPEAVRPRYSSSDPFLVAFDFQRNTFRWSYEDDKPKGLTEIAIQKMLRLEVARAGLRKGISAQHLRNTFILRALLKGLSVTEIQQQLGLRTALSLNRYVLTVNQLTKREREELLSK